MIKIETYALALFEVVSEPMAHYDDIKRFRAYLQDEDVLRVFARNYAEPKVLDPLWATLKFKVETTRLLKILQADQRILDFQRFVESYQDLLMHHNHLTKADVTVAHKLNDLELENLKTLLSKQYPGVLELQVSEDPSLIKGMVAQVNNDVIDTSIKHKLQQIKRQGGK